MKRKKAITWLYNELPVLIKQGILSDESAQEVRRYYGEIDQQSRAQTALSIFSVIGAVCVGLGIILLFAYNWDTLSRPQRTSLAFAPLVLSILLIAWSIFKNKSSVAIREGFSVFNMLAVGGAIALISQIYHLPGDIDSFMLVWMLLSVPLVYLMSSSLTAVFYLIGITVWAAWSQTGGGHAAWYWPLVAVIFPYYLEHLKKDPYASRPVWLSYALGLCLTVGLGVSLEKVLPGTWIIVYSSFYSILYLLSKFCFDDAPSNWQRPFRNIGMAGIVILSYLFTYDGVWEHIGWEYYRVGGRFYEAAGVVDCLIAIALVAVFASLVLKMAKEKRLFEISFGIMPVLATLCYGCMGSGGHEFIAMWVFNLYVLYLGIICVLTGLENKKLDLLNGGIFIMGAVILTRFLDSTVGILERGLIFIVIGACFIIANMSLANRIEGEVQK